MRRIPAPLPCLLLAPLLLAGLLLAGCRGLPPTSRAEPLVVLVSIDGLRADVVGTGRMPTLDALASAGIRAEWMNPAYPTLTFPNHYTLVTGRRPDRHGIVANYMDDPVLGRFESKRDSARDGRWWVGGEPLWATLQRHGGIAATMFWPGSEADIAGQRPRHWRRFDGAMAPEARVDQVLAWLDLPRRPQFVTLYLEQVDVASHHSGTHSAEAHAAMARVDAALARLLRGLEARGLRGAANLVVLSDHGMADSPRAQVRFVDDVLAPEAYTLAWWGEVVGLDPHPGRTADVEAAFLGRRDHYTCWRKAELPARWKFGTHPRIPPVVCQADVGWRVQSRAQPMQAQAVKGEHGYAPEAPEMRAVFVADGPAFADGRRLPPFDNVDVYPLLARLLGVPAAPHDGDAARFDAVLAGAAATPD